MSFLSALELKHLKQERMRYLKNNKVKIRYPMSEWQPSFENSADTDMSSWEEYWCTVEVVSKLTLEKYPFAKVAEGDLVIELPADTDLPLDRDKYEIDYMGKIYEVSFEPQPYVVIQNEILSYVMTGEYNA